MTDKEKELVLELGRIWNQFLQLPEERSHDADEFRFAIHAAQAQILKRQARRDLNEV